MAKVIIAGAGGRMGRRIGYMVNEHPELQVAAGFERHDSPDVGKDMGELGGYGTSGIKVADDLEKVIDQLNQDNLQELAELCEDFPCVQAPNMAVGVNVLFKLAAKVASILGNDYDMEIVEAHHRMKKDAPSGTAMKLGELMASAVGRNLDEHGVFSRHGIIGERSDEEIGLQTIRAGDIVGEHTVYFAGAGERLELTHRAHNRDNFARGAALAAAWVVKQHNGLFNMFDVLGLQDL